jgi:hypothetical protein
VFNFSVIFLATSTRRGSAASTLHSLQTASRSPSLTSTGPSPSCRHRSWTPLATSATTPLQSSPTLMPRCRTISCSPTASESPRRQPAYLTTWAGVQQALCPDGSTRLREDGPAERRHIKVLFFRKISQYIRDMVNLKEYKTLYDLT